jgi:hypothetical protein
MANGDTTKVRFELWAVLGFLTFVVALCLGYLFNTLAEGRSARILADQQMDIRVTRLETKFDHISIGIDELKKGQDKVVDALIEHERSTREMKEIAAKVKRWQDVPASRGNN